MKKTIKRIIVFLFGFLDVLTKNKNQIVFLSFDGKAYSDNPRYISELVQKELPDIKVIWYLKNNSNYINNCTCVKSKILLTYYLLTSKIWVTNFGIPFWTRISSKKLLISTWHGDRGFKKCMLASPNTTKDEANQVKEFSKSIDFFITGSIFAEEKICKAAFDYSGKILKVGCPRNDILINENKDFISEIKESLNISKECKILLYAPTFRNTRNYDSINSKKIDFKRLIYTLEKKSNKKWIVLFRCHPGVKFSMNNEYETTDVSDYEEMSHLLLISDMLITDYSSCAGDYILLNRPIIHYIPDLEDYTKGRDMWFGPKEAGYFYVQNNDELIDLVNSLSEERIKDNCKRVREFFGEYETGHATEEVIKVIKDFLNKK